MPAELRVFENNDGTFEAIELLEALLERAKAGEVTAFSFSAIDDKNIVVTGWSKPSCGQHTRLVGSLSYLQFRMNRHMDEVIL